MDIAGAEEWMRGHVEPTGVVERVHERPWSTVLRVAVVDGVVWLKVCGPVQAFEPALTADLFSRWPDRVSPVLAHDEAHGWLLLGDAGTAVVEIGNPPELWLDVLPLYAELQRDEVAHVRSHLEHGVPDLQVATLPARYERLLRSALPLERDEVERLRDFVPAFEQLCLELDGHDVANGLQHDDLHMNNLFIDGEQLRVLDWGDSSIAQPFASLVVTFRFLEERNKLAPDDPWFARLRDAYLEPWGRDLTETFALALRVGAFAHAIAWMRQRDLLSADQHSEFDRGYATILRRALSQTF